MLHAGILGDQPLLTAARTTDLCSRFPEWAPRLALIPTRSFVRSLVRSFVRLLVRSSRVGMGKPRPPSITRTCRICVVFLRRTRRSAPEHRCAAQAIKIQSRSCGRTDTHVWVTAGGAGALGARCALARSLHVRWLHSLAAFAGRIRWFVRWFVGPLVRLLVRSRAFVTCVAWISGTSSSPRTPYACS
jgi:hypothetical protein